jgi:hypothetical protein
MSQPLALAIMAFMTTTAHALPLRNFTKRDMGTGAKAGLGVGIAVAAILAIGLIVFLIMHFRRSWHNQRLNNERAVLAGEKNADGTDKPDKFSSESSQAPVEQPQVSAIPRRNKSVKDRLMGPLYRGSVIDLHPLPKARIPGVDRNSKRMSTMTMESNSDAWNKPYVESSPRPSFSSKRATRMMMMM